jgi:hypothetical protein
VLRQLTRAVMSLSMCAYTTLSLKGVPGSRLPQPGNSNDNVKTVLHCTGTSIQGVTKGAYIVKDCGHVPDVILMGTGSELELAYQAALVSALSELRFVRLSGGLHEAGGQQAISYIFSNQQRRKEWT